MLLFWRLWALLSSCFAKPLRTASGSSPRNNQAFLLSLRWLCKCVDFGAEAPDSRPYLKNQGWGLELVVDQVPPLQCQTSFSSPGTWSGWSWSSSAKRRGREVCGGLLIFPKLFTEVVTPPKFFLLSWNVKIMSRIYFCCLPPVSVNFEQIM